MVQKINNSAPNDTYMYVCRWFDYVCILYTVIIIVYTTMCDCSWIFFCCLQGYLLPPAVLVPGAGQAGDSS